MQLVQLRRGRSCWRQPFSISAEYARHPCSLLRPDFSQDAALCLYQRRGRHLGVGVSPGHCHYIEGNYFARRKFTLFKEFLEYNGIEPGRLNFSWISSAEGVKFAHVANTVIEEVRNLGPAKHFIKTGPERLTAI